MPQPTPTQDITRDFFKYHVSDIGKLLVFMVNYLGQLEGSGFGGTRALKELGGAVVVGRLLFLIIRVFDFFLGNASSCTFLSWI